MILPGTTYRSLLELTNLLISEVDSDKFFNCLANYFQEKFSCDRISLSIYRAESDSLDWFAAALGVNVTKMDGKQPLRGPLCRLAITTKQIEIIPDLKKYKDHIAIKYMLDAGLRSAIAIPLISRNTVVAAIVISYASELPENINDLISIIKILSPQITIAVENMLIYDRLKQQNEYLHDQIDSILKSDDMDQVTTRFFFSCTAMKEIMQQITTISNSDVPVLLSGETGTGKEFLARYIHSNSKRSDNNFIKVSCPALSPTLFESELFGHAKGAFTGALSRRIGRFELANKGSIFLDEIGELDIILQAKLLHVLQDASFERVGESSQIDVDVRCISATNADLYKMMNEGTFRRDLFYRMGVATIQIPALRDRKGEALLMFNHLIKLYSNDMEISEPMVHASTEEILEKYDWPGNVRELSNMVSRILVLHHKDKIITPDHVLPLMENNAFGRKTSLEQNNMSQQFHKTSLPITEDNSLANMEKAHLESVLAQTQGRIGGPLGAAKLLNIPRTTLQYKLKKYNISPNSFKQ